MTFTGVPPISDGSLGIVTFCTGVCKMAPPSCCMKVLPIGLNVTAFGRSSTPTKSLYSTQLQPPFAHSSNGANLGCASIHWPRCDCLAPLASRLTPKYGCGSTEKSAANGVRLLIAG